jgi:cell division septation protein DedD
LGPRLVPTYVVRADGTIVETTATSSAATDPIAAQNQQLVTETEPIEPVPVPTVAIADGGSANDATAAEPSALTAAPADTTTPDAAAPSASEDLSPRPSIDDETATVASASPSSEPAAPPAGGEEGNTENSLASAEPAAPPATAASGGFLVQLSAQRSMDEAQSAYAAAQQRYPSVLSSLTAQIQEADLGAKGIFYRVRVGPWESRDDAIKVCEALKAEGGNCFVTQ